MMTWAQVEEQDVFLELGSGTGRLSLMAARYYGIQCVGVDCILPFVEYANRIWNRELSRKVHSACCLCVP